MDMKRLDHLDNSLVLDLIDDRIAKLERELRILDDELTDKPMSPKKLSYSGDEV